MLLHKKKIKEQNISGDIMKNEMPHITVGQSESDLFLLGERSKTMEHENRLRSDFCDLDNIEKTYKSMKTEENQR